MCREDRLLPPHPGTSQRWASWEGGTPPVMDRCFIEMCLAQNQQILRGDRSEWAPVWEGCKL